MHLDYTPVMICETDRTTFHESETNSHIAMHGNTILPCSIRMLSEQEHFDAGWDIRDYPHIVH